MRKLQKRIADLDEQIAWVNKEETMYKVPLSAFPEVEQIKTEVDPFLKLFQTVQKFQRADKRWLYGNFRELNAEAIEGELDEYSRDVYKVQKYFNNKVKKLLMEIEERERERKRRRRGSSERRTSGDAGAPPADGAPAEGSAPADAAGAETRRRRRRRRPRRRRTRCRRCTCRPRSMCATR